MQVHKPLILKEEVEVEVEKNLLFSFLKIKQDYISYHLKIWIFFLLNLTPFQSMAFPRGPKHQMPSMHRNLSTFCLLFGKCVQSMAYFETLCSSRPMLEESLLTSPKDPSLFAHSHSNIFFQLLQQTFSLKQQYQSTQETNSNYAQIKIPLKI